MLRILLIILCLIEGGQSLITCKIGSDLATTEINHCSSCYTKTVLGIVTYGCTPSGVECDSSSLECCFTSLCNVPVALSSVGPRNLTCYTDLSGRNGFTMSNCGYCQTISTNLVITTYVQQLCVSACVPTDTGVTKTDCCQTNLCNAHDLGVKSLISCKVGSSLLITEKNNCAACYTETLTGASTYGCTPPGSSCNSTNTTKCCSRNMCNAHGQNNITCYHDLSGRNGSTKSGCGYCQTVSTDLGFTISVQQLCVSVCVHLGVEASKTACCETNLCNVANLGTQKMISCKVGSDGHLSEIINCASCYSTKTLGIVTYGCTAPGLPCNSDSTTTCCSTNLCNAPVEGASASGLTCYSDLTGRNGSTMSGCGYCQTIITNLIFTRSLLQLCVPVCVPVDLGVSKTTCCKTNLCNSADLARNYISCIVGVGSATSEVSDCSACSTEIYAEGIIRNCIPASAGRTCAPNSHTTCCTTHLCNGDSDSSAGLVCFNDPAGRGASIQSNCGYCQVIETSTTVQQLCVPWCVSVDRSTANATCCQTILCNKLERGKVGKVPTVIFR